MNSIISPFYDKSRFEAAEKIHREVSHRYETELRDAGIWGRLMIRLKIAREVRAEMKRKFPPHGLYAARLLQ